jgi:hypothetical protein
MSEAQTEWVHNESKRGLLRRLVLPLAYSHVALTPTICRHLSKTFSAANSNNITVTA